MTVSTVTIFVVLALIALQLLFLFVHLLSRAALRTDEERQQELEGAILMALQSATPADQLAIRIRRSPSRIARRSLTHVYQTLSEEYRGYFSYIYDQLNYNDRALRDLRSWSWNRRADALLELGVFRRPEAIAPCLALLRDPHLEVRAAAMRMLCDLRSPGTLRPLLESNSNATRRSISDTVEFLRSFGLWAAPELLAILTQSYHRAARLTAMEALGEFAYAEAGPAVEAFLNDPDMELRIFATRAIGRIGGANVFACMEQALRDPAWQVRAVAARALGAYREPQATILLEAGLTDPAWWVRLNSAESLVRQESRGIDALRKSLKSTDTFARDMATQMLQYIEKPA